MPRAASAPALSIAMFLASAAVALLAHSARAEDGAWVPLDPGPRVGHTLVADPARARALHFGGWDGSGSTAPGAFHDETWVLDLAGHPRWRLMSTDGPSPPPRVEHVAVRDPVRDRLIVFGGRTGKAYRDDLWALDLAHDVWAPLAAAGPQPPPLETRAVYDPVRDRIVFFGGRDPDGDLDGLWQLSLAGSPTWGQLEAAGDPPSPRHAHTIVYDPVGDRIIVFGGQSGSTSLGDVWALTLSGTPAWSRLTPAGESPDPRHGHVAILDPLRQRMVVLGGLNWPTQFMSDAWALDLAGPPAWTALDLGGPLPPPRDFAAAVLDAGHDRIVVQGGNTVTAYDENGAPVTDVLSDLWTVDLGDDAPAVRVAAAPEASAGRVRLHWQARGLASCRVLRSEANGPWTERARLRPSDEQVRWDDRALKPGAAYAYRLAWTEGRVERFGGVVRVTASAGLPGDAQADRHR